MRIIETATNGHVYAGTFGGFMLSVFSSVFINDLLRTIILAAIGAIVSFIVSMSLKYLFKRFKR